MSLRDDVSTDSSSSRISQYPKEMKLLCVNKVSLPEPTQWEKQLEAEESEMNSSPPPSLFHIENERCTKDWKRTFLGVDTINKYSTIRRNGSYALLNPLRRNTTDDMESMSNTRVAEIGTRPKSGNKNKPRWNRKHLSEIEEDKSMLHTWFEHGIVSKAYAPRCPKSLDSEESSTEVDVSKPTNSRNATLGDFMPISAMNEISEEHNILELEGNENPESSQDISWDYSHVNVLTFTTENQENNIDNSVVQNQSNVNSIDEPSIGLNTNMRNISLENDTLNKVGCEIDTPLCWHGIKYHAERFSESLFCEAGMLLEKLPRRRIYTFADAIRALGSAVEHLQCKCRNDRELTCTRDHCYWQRTMIHEFNRREKRASNRALNQVNDLVSFEIKLAEVYSPKSKLKALLKDAYNPNDMGRCAEHFLTIKYKKALQSLEDAKSKDFNMVLDMFADNIFTEICALLETLPEKESQHLRSSVSTFNNAIWKMRDIERKARIKDNKLKCCNFFRLKKSEREKMFSEPESEHLIKIKPNECKPLVKSVSCQTDSIEAINIDVPDTQNWPRLPVKQYSDAVKNSYVPPRQLSPTVEDETSFSDCKDCTAIDKMWMEAARNLAVKKTLKDLFYDKNRTDLDYHYSDTSSDDSESEFASVFDSECDNRPENVDVSLYEEAKTNPEVYYQYSMLDIDEIGNKVTIRKNGKETVLQGIPKCLLKRTGDKPAPLSNLPASEISNEVRAPKAD